jgi:hypothetical protein
VNANSSLPDAYAKRPRQQSGPIMKTIILTQDLLTAAALGCAMALTPAHGADAPKMKMTTETPASITTPDEVKTRLGTLKFTDGFSDQATAQACYDNLDFQHAVQAYLAGLPAVSVEGIRQGLSGLGPANQTVCISETLLDSKSLFLTAPFYRTGTGPLSVRASESRGSRAP